MCAVTMRLTTPEAPTSGLWANSLFGDVSAALVSSPSFPLLCTAMHLLSFAYWDAQNTRVFMLCSLACR